MRNAPANIAGFRKLANGLVATVDADGNTLDVMTEDEADELGDAIAEELYPTDY